MAARYCCGTRQAVPMFAATSVEAFEPPMDMGPLDAAAPQPVHGINGFVRSTDGKRALFTALGDLWLLERGKKPQRLTDDPHIDIDPAFTSDGESVVYASDRTGGFELWRLSLRDQRTTQLTFGSTRAHAPAPSPDGRHIAYLESEGLGPWAPQRLTLLGVTSQREPLTLVTGLEAAETIQWTPDGRTVRVRAAAAAMPRGVPAQAQVNVEIVSAHGCRARRQRAPPPARGAAMLRCRPTPST